MAGSYELFLRVADGGSIAAEELTRILDERRLEGVTAEPFIGDTGDATRPRGLDLALGPAGGVDALLDVAFDVARELGLEVYDPQLGSAILASDRERVRGHCEDILAFRADTLGDASQLVGAPPPPAGSRTTLHLWLIVGGVVVAFVLLARGCRYFI